MIEMKAHKIVDIFFRLLSLFFCSHSLSLSQCVSVSVSLTIAVIVCSVECAYVINIHAITTTNIRAKKQVETLLIFFSPLLLPFFLRVILPHLSKVNLSAYVRACVCSVHTNGHTNQSTNQPIDAAIIECVKKCLIISK